MATDRRQTLTLLGGLTFLSLAPRLHAASPGEVSEVLLGYSSIAFASYSAALEAAVELQGRIASFLSSPSDESLLAARTAWLAARDWYGQTEAFRFYGGPIDGRGGPEGRINAWPVDASYIDYVRSKPNAGMIGDAGFDISEESLAGRNELNGEANICTGWHAMEFLLWGQDQDQNGPGRRPFTDYVPGGAPNADRRRRVLEVVTSLLVKDLDTVQQAWHPQSGAYRSGFATDETALRKIFVGLGTLARSELAGERLEVALDTQQQEDEQSCFSDNTHRDFISGITGIRNVWRGEFRAADGARLSAAPLRNLVEAATASGAAATDAKLDQCMNAALALQPPFDREIVGADSAPGRRRAFALLHALQELSDSLANDAAGLGIRGLASMRPD